MTKVRYEELNGVGIKVRIRHMFGLFYTTSHYLDSDKRVAEAKMLKAIATIKKAYADYDSAIAEVKFAQDAIKNSTHALKHTSSVFDKHVTWKNWIRSFGLISLYPKQHDTWQPVVKLLMKMGNGTLVSAVNMHLNMVRTASEPLRIPTDQEAKKNNGGGGKKNKGNQQTNNGG